MSGRERAAKHAAMVSCREMNDACACENGGEFNGLLCRIRYDAAIAALGSGEAAAQLLEALLELSDAVFGRQIGDYPNVYADYDRLCELQGKCRRALKFGLAAAARLRQKREQPGQL